MTNIKVDIRDGMVSQTLHVNIFLYMAKASMLQWLGKVTVRVVAEATLVSPSPSENPGSIPNPFCWH
jgi:hypothetical protein